MWLLPQHAVGVVYLACSREVGTLIRREQMDVFSEAARRNFEGLFLKHGKVVRFVLVPEAACAGEVTIDATLGTQKKTLKINLACGE